MKEDIEQRVKKVIADFLRSNVKAEDIDSENEELMSTYGIDSIKVIQLIVLIENEFDIEFEDQLVGRKFFKSVKAISEYIKKKMEVAH
ncbi:MAG: acyl carrier protein [Ruminiclostridium sp.]